MLNYRGEVVWALPLVCPTTGKSLKNALCESEQKKQYIILLGAGPKSLSTFWFNLKRLWVLLQLNLDFKILDSGGLHDESNSLKLG